VNERRILQLVVAVACLVPLTTGAESIWRGAAWLAKAPVPTDLDSHFRYVSGIFFALGVAVATCVPGIERKGARFRLLGLTVVAGGLARLWSLVEVGVPGRGHLFGLAMELGVVPLLMLWQRRIETRDPGSAPR
jgi:hypothetical protein